MRQILEEFTYELTLRRVDLFVVKIYILNEEMKLILPLSIFIFKLSTKYDSMIDSMMTRKSYGDRLGIHRISGELDVHVLIPSIEMD